VAGFKGEARFVRAVPIWPEGRASERNLSIGFRALVEKSAEPTTLRVTAASLYRAWCNGHFVGHGPARAAHGAARVDEWALSPFLREAENIVAIEVAGYAVNSYYLLKTRSFLQAEVAAGDSVLAATGPEGEFGAHVLAERVQRAQRYSFQRPFAEVYRLAPGFDAWRENPKVQPGTLALEQRPAAKLLPRRVPYPRFERRMPISLIASGTIRTGIDVAQPWRDRALISIGLKLGGYLEPELETVPSLALQEIGDLTREQRDEPYDPGAALPLSLETFHLLDLGCNLTGFIGARIRCMESGRIYLTFDEILRDGDVDWKRLDCVNAITIDLEPGEHVFESIEPYTLRYLKVLAVSGDCSISQIMLCELANPDADGARFAASDERLELIFEAARETLRQNAVDIFMDCPSRERAGWLCDSFFAARAAFFLCGATTVERNFVENYLLAERFEHLPEGMLPMCYPADHDDGVYIPNWAMWFVLQLTEYLTRSGDRATVEALRPRVLALLAFLEGYRNEDGLLEKLPSWVFVEWSRANAFVQDVSYPSNMLYAAALEAAAELYDLPELARSAAAIRETIRAQSFDGTFFVDNALRRDGELEVTDNRTEVCQYFAFYFDVATPHSHPELWQRLVQQFGPDRAETGSWPEIHAANAFVGTVLRLELLARYGRTQQLMDESVDYLLYMADRTGTLWEHQGDYASCNHGFASHAGYVLLRDVLGIQRIDTINRRLAVRFPDVELACCRGAIPTPDGEVELAWRRDGDVLRYELASPAGYELDIDNRSGLRLESS
jgi:alpha-L-rhamnosidase